MCTFHTTHQTLAYAYLLYFNLSSKNVTFHHHYPPRIIMNTLILLLTFIIDIIFIMWIELVFKNYICVPFDNNIIERSQKLANSFFEMLLYISTKLYLFNAGNTSKIWANPDSHTQKSLKICLMHTMNILIRTYMHIAHSL